jgi:hypothetical protein
MIGTDDYAVRGNAGLRASDVSTQSSSTLLTQARNLCFLDRQQQMDSANLADLASTVPSAIKHVFHTDRQIDHIVLARKHTLPAKLACQHS